MGPPFTFYPIDWWFTHCLISPVGDSGYRFFYIIIYTYLCGKEAI